MGCHPVAVIQYTFTHKQYIERHKTNNTCLKCYYNGITIIMSDLVSRGFAIFSIHPKATQRFVKCQFLPSDKRKSGDVSTDLGPIGKYVLSDKKNAT